MKLRKIAWALLACGALLAAPAAYAADDEGQSLEERIKKKMERILELMQKNEAALLELSTGASAETRRVDVPVPEGDPGAGSTAAGEDAAEELRKLAEGQRKASETIPGELRELVELIPL